MTKYLYNCKVLNYNEAFEECRKMHPELTFEQLIKYFNDFVMQMSDERAKEILNTKLEEGE